MHFETNHDLPGTREQVADVLCDPEFHEALELPDLSKPEVVEATTTGSVRVVKLRYEFVGHIDPIAQKVIGNRKLTWLQDMELDVSTWRGSLTFAAEADPGRLNGKADIALDAPAATKTRQTIAGDLHVRVPLIGGRAERSIVPGIVRRLDVSADALAAALKARG